MAFREKSAWVMAIALLLGGVFYGAVVISGSQALGESMPPLIPVIAVYVGLLVVVSIIGHIGAAITSGPSADNPMDERELQIASRSTALSDYIMGVGILISLGLYLVSYDGNRLFHLVFATLMLAQFTQYAAQIIMFHRQSAMAD